MSKIIKIFILYTIIMAAAIMLFLVLYNKKSDIKYLRRDMSYYNDSLRNIYEDYIDGIKIQEIEKKYECHIILSKELVDKELTNYYSMRSMVLDFSPGGEYLGKIVWEDGFPEVEKLRDSVRQVVVFFWTGILIIGYFTIVLIYYILIRPVSEMNKYASEIAKGNLDVNLPIHKDNMFGSFTESFDMMREALKASREREMESEKARKELVAALSHDIKTPIATIQATCEVLDMQLGIEGEKTENTEKISNMREKVGIISSKADMINGLISNIFHATLEELEKIEMNVSEENSEIISDYFGRVQNYGNVILDNNIPQCLVYMDKLRMEQVIDNIIGNSHKYAGTDIHVSFSEIKNEPVSDSEKGKVAGDFIKIRISDSGPGVPEEDLPLLTEKYYRGKTVKDKTGYGLGMYLVKLYMEKQNGGLEYYNDNGFVVELFVKKV